MHKLLVIEDLRFLILIDDPAKVAESARAQECGYRRTERCSAKKTMQARTASPDAISATDSVWVQMAVKPRKEWANARTGTLKRAIFSVPGASTSPSAL